jgi:hypothetical protein
MNYENVRSEFIWLKTGTSEGIFGSHRMLGISGLTVALLASQGLRSMELFS